MLVIQSLGEAAEPEAPIRHPPVYHPDLSGLWW